MATKPQLRVLFFDVFGTCVAQRTPVADELSRAAKEALESNTSISNEVRTKATEMVCPKQLSSYLYTQFKINFFCRHTSSGSTSQGLVAKEGT